MARKNKPKLPSAGEAFAFPVGDGRFSVCRVLLDQRSEQSKEWDTAVVLAACSNWIGSEIPTPDNPALRTILHKTHHLWHNEPCLWWISELPPSSFIPIGIIQPTAEEQHITCMTFGNWSSLIVQPLLQWRWDHERESVLAEDVIKREEEKKSQESAAQKRKQYLKEITLEKLRKHKFFANWTEYPALDLIRASRTIMSKTVSDLLQLDPTVNEVERMTILQACIESFNQLDAQKHFIETVEREDICEEFEAIVHACGLGNHNDLADKWRDW